MSCVLSCESISVHFGPFVALRDLSLTFESQRTTALIGPNGAGKTTLLNVLSGLQPATRGRVSVDERDITRLPNWKRARMGLMRSFQIVSVCPGISVFDNLQLAVMHRKAPNPVFWRSADSDRSLRPAVEALAEQYGLAAVGKRQAATLSHGEQRLLELALSLVNDPPVLLLDEPLAGVGHAELASFIEHISRACSGRTVVLVEHNMDAVMALADHIVCLAAGAVLAQGSPEAVRNDPAVRSAYLGAH